jgi:hypothetical protein
MPWLPQGFQHPERVDLPTGDHLRPIRGADADIDYPAVMGSRERLWAKYAEAWRWPPDGMTYEQDKKDLARHEAEIAAHEAFNYAVLDAEETELLGCVYIDPPRNPRHRELTPSSRGGWSTKRAAPTSSAHSKNSCPAGWPRAGDSSLCTTHHDA